MEFDRELATYLKHLMDLVQHEGRYVVVLGDEILGPFDTYEAALKGGYDRFGVVAFLVQKVHRPEAEPIHYFTRDMPQCTS